MNIIDNETVVKIALNCGISKDDLDEDIIFSIISKANTVIAYLNNGGAKINAEEITPLELGCISSGVNDLLNNTAGGTEFSPAFKLIAMQLCTAGGVKNG